MLHRQSDSMRERLRAATGTAHARLDHAASALRLEAITGYRRFLAAHGSTIVPLEIALESGGIAYLLQDWPTRSRRAALEDDLRALDIQCEALPAPVFAGDAALMGAAYVLEGSRLGARIVLQRILPGAPSRYLRHGEGENLWGSFTAQLEACDAVRAHPGEAIGAALEVFAMFETAICDQTAQRAAA